MSRPGSQIIAGLLCTCVAVGQGSATDQAPQTPIPNFSSTDFPWFTVGGIRPPASGLGPVAMVSTDIVRREADQFGNVSERRMTVADTKNPNLKPWVADALRKANENRIAGKLLYAARGSCMPAGLPGFLTYGGGFQPLYIIQTPKEVVMINHGDSQIRHIYLNVPHTSKPSPSWYGESVGHYEGDMLVVDTIGLNDKTLLEDGIGLPHTTQLHVIERIKLLPNGNLQAEFMIDDPGAFNAPWSGIVTWKRNTGVYINGVLPLAEEPCADENVAHGGAFFPEGTGTDVGFPIPAAGKPDF